MSATELPGLGLAGLARAIAEGAVSSREATLAVMAALDGPGRELGVLARLTPELALAQADRADAAHARGELLGPLHGVPLAHKDMFYRAGELAECGTELLRGHRPDRTATVIARLEAAGAVDVGRLNMVEFALGITGHNAHTGHPRNPWDRSRVTGGSTSGGAAAVAARLLPATLGSDTGGSIRVPAALCGILGLKPTYGRVSRHGCMPLSWSLDHVGPLACSAEDLALLLRAIAGRDPADPTTSLRPMPDYRHGLAAEVRGLRVALAAGGLDVTVEPAVAAAVTAAAEVLAGLGLVVEPRPMPSFDAFNALRRVVMLAECAALHRERIARQRDRYNASTLERLLPGFALSAADHQRALAARARELERFCAGTMAGVDLVLMPMAPCAAPEIALTEGGPGFSAVANRLGALAGPINYLGLPALSVPVGSDADGLPLAMQLVGRPFAEGLLLRVAHAYGAATDHARRRPALQP